METPLGQLVTYAILGRINNGNNEMIGCITEVSGVPGFPVTATASEKTDMYVAQGRIGRINLSSACHNWHEVLAMVAADLTRRGEDAAVRARLKARVISVRAFLQERYGIFTGPREYFHDSWMTPDRADLKEFLRAIREAK